MTANNFQVGGLHYKSLALEHWDLVVLDELDYFQGQITKYVMRWRGKNGILDLRKARHFIDKYIEVEELRASGKLTVYILAAALKRLEELNAKYEEEDHAKALRAAADEAATRCITCGYMPPMHAGNCTAQR